MNLERKFYNAPEIAKIMGISRVAAYELCHKKDFPAIRINGGKRVIIPIDAFNRWVEEQTGSKKDVI